MTHTISFRNIDPVGHLREFVEEYMERTIEQQVKNWQLRSNVIIERKQLKSKSHNHSDFCCEIVLYHPSLRRTVVARKSSNNFYKSVREACKAIEKILRRLSQTKSKRRHKNYESVIREGDGNV